MYFIWLKLHYTVFNIQYLKSVAIQYSKMQHYEGNMVTEY